MNFEEPPVGTTCDTCRYIAEQGGTTTALDAYEVLRRRLADSPDRIRELEQQLAEARARIAALEAERDEFQGRLDDLRKERDSLWLSRERMRVALEQIQNGEAIGGLYGHATEIARAALAGEEKP